MSLKITVLGSGTSSGVPTIGCTCEVCRSVDPRDTRLRPSVLIQHEGRNIVIDTGPDFRAQVLRAGIQHLDAIIYTHAHADHILGLDDIRPFNYHQGARIPIYVSRPAFATIERVFQYVFDKQERSTNVPKLDVHLIDETPFDVLGMRFEPIPLIHGKDTIFGYRFADVAYLTDHNEIPPSSLDRLRDLEVLFLDALRYRPHPTHTTVERSVEIARMLNAKRTYLTHMCHDVGQAAGEAKLPPNIFLAYDDLEIDVPVLKRFRSPAEIPADFGPSVVAIGNFDGLHAGHREIMRRAAFLAREIGAAPTVLTFDPHPARVLAPERAPKLLMTIDQRLRAMEAEGIDAVLLLPFSLEFAKLTPEEFAETILAKTLHARVVLVGEDFRFGCRQSGNVDTLRTLGERLGFRLEAIAPVSRRRERVSSTGVRKLIESGRVSRACRMLGAPFALEGSVVKGQGIGSKQTVPTLNLAPENEVLPKTGVYVTRTRDLETRRTWPSITNVGYRPTFNGNALTVETFLLQPLTGEHPNRIEVAFLAFVRDERRFENPEALRGQILRDANVAERLHRRLKNLHMG